ncbi:MAG: general secretion pathway protein GspK [Rhizobiales bacterium]|nr:general secretion pathway protein GspK [Hyphomicrobiales bacterium]
MASAAFKVGRKSSDGFILVAVLWILGGLAVLAAIYALYVVNAATSLEANNDRIQTNASVSAALELTAYYLGAVKPQERPTSGQFNFRVGGSNVAVGFRSEAARIDLNSAQPPLLAGLFRVFGAPSDAANNYAERVIGWRANATNTNPDQDKETTAYRNAGLTYDPRQAPFTNVQELWLVLGLPPAFVERAMPFFTVFSGMPTVNVIDAAPEVIAALPGMTPERLDAFLKQRHALRQDVNSVFQLLGPARVYATVQGSKAIRVTVRVELAKGRHINAEAVILLLEDAPDPYRVLSWTDDFDG